MLFLCLKQSSLPPFLPSVRFQLKMTSLRWVPYYPVLSMEHFMQYCINCFVKKKISSASPPKL